MEPRHPGWRHLCQRTLDAATADGVSRTAGARVGTGLYPWAWFAVDVAADSTGDYPPVIRMWHGRARTKERAERAARRALCADDASTARLERANTYGGQRRALLGHLLIWLAIGGVLLASVSLVVAWADLFALHNVGGARGGAVGFVGGILAAIGCFVADEALRIDGAL